MKFYTDNFTNLLVVFLYEKLWIKKGHINIIIMQIKRIKYPKMISSPMISTNVYVFGQKSPLLLQLGIVEVSVLEDLVNVLTIPEVESQPMFICLFNKSISFHFISIWSELLFLSQATSCLLWVSGRYLLFIILDFELDLLPKFKTNTWNCTDIYLHSSISYKWYIQYTRSSIHDNSTW